LEDEKSWFSMGGRGGALVTELQEDSAHGGSKLLTPDLDARNSKKV